MKAIGYLRVSTTGQALDGVSLEMQRSKVEAWASLNDSTMLAVYSDEGLSGSNADRPGLQAALAHAKREKAALVVYSLSRFSRSTIDTLRLVEELSRSGCEFVSLTEKLDTTTPAGRVVLRVLAALSEFEREQIGDRTSAALRHLKAAGKRYGKSIPHGFRLDGERLVRDEGEAEVMRLAKALRDRGLSLRKISKELEARGAFNREGRPFSACSVASLLRAA